MRSHTIRFIVFFSICTSIFFCTYLIIKKLSSAPSPQKTSIDIDYHVNQGAYFFEQEKYARAAQEYIQAIKANPNALTEHINLGLCLEKLNKQHQALQFYTKILKRWPTCTKAHLRASNLYLQMSQFDAAHTTIDKLLAQQPTIEVAHYIKSSIFFQEGALDAGISYLENVLKKYPNQATLHQNLGNFYEKKNNFHAAYTAYTQAITYDPTNPYYYVNRSAAQLGMGNYDGWAHDYEHRWNYKKFDALKKYLWDGSPLKNKTIVLHGENGFGDMLQYIRFIPNLKQQGATVIARVPRALVPLLQCGCPYIDRVITAHELATIGHHDAISGFMSLPYYFPITETTIPQPPYINADQQLITYWQKKLAGDTNIKIGICWQSSPADAHNIPQSKRAMPYEQYAPLAQLPGISVYTLQKERDPQRLAQLGIRDFGDFDTQHGAFMDTAAIMKNLDLVITIDTVTAHLAGALNVPVWVLLPAAADVRWMKDRTDTLWYPSMRLFRSRTAHDWTYLIQQVCQEVQLHFGSNL